MLHVQVKREHFFPLSLSGAIKAPINSGDLGAHHGWFRFLSWVHVEPYSFVHGLSPLLCEGAMPSFTIPSLESAAPQLAQCPSDVPGSQVRG